MSRSAGARDIPVRVSAGAGAGVGGDAGAGADAGAVEGLKVVKGVQGVGDAVEGEVGMGQESVDGGGRKGERGFLRPWKPCAHLRATDSMCGGETI